MSAVSLETAASPAQRHAAVGMWTLLRLAVRRERIATPVWVFAISLTVIATALTLPELYLDDEARQARLVLMANPAAIALGGPLFNVDDYTFGAMMTNEMMGFMAIFTALMSILMVVRHTRTDEETGRTELIRANVVGRHAPLAAALALALIANLLIVVVVAVGLGSAGIESITWSGSWLFALAMGMVGVVFAAVAAVAAQINENGRAASGMAGLILGISFALRAAGDIGENSLSWLSPIGWAQRTYAYVDDRWWPLLLGIAVFVLLAGLAVVLGDRRDVGAGLLAVKTGRAHAARSLASPLALALRLQRGVLIGWSVSLLGFGVLFGLLLADMEGFAAEVGVIEDLIGEIGEEMAMAFIGLLVMMLAMAAAVYAVSTVLRARGEETGGRAEPVLAAPVARVRWLSSWVLIAIVGSVAVLTAGALGLGLTGAIVLADGSVFGSTMAASAQYHVANLLMVGVAVALFGLLPSASAGAWAVLTYALTAGFLGGLLGLPEWAVDLAIYTSLPLMPVEEFALVPTALLALIGVCLLVAGFAGFRRRDLTTTA